MSEETSYLRRHPKEMFWLAITEMCQRFAFWGVGNLLVLFLIQYYDFSVPAASHLYGLFICLAFILPVLGGYVADRWNYTSPVIWGFILTGFGCLLLGTTIRVFLYPALISLAIGGSVFTPSIYALLNKAYSNKHHLREVGFSIYYSAVNIGVFLAMILLGLLISLHGWKTVFITAAFVQILGLIAFRKALSYFSHEATKGHPKSSSSIKSASLTKIDIDRLIVIGALSFASIIFWITYSQNGSSMILFANDLTARTIGSFAVPPSWFVSAETAFLVILVIPLTKLYTYLRSKKKEPSPIHKSVYGMIATALCFCVMFIGSEGIEPGTQSAQTSPWVLIISFFFMAIAELLMAPIILSVITNLSPRRFTAMLVGIWYLFIGISYYIGGIMAGWYAWMPLTEFWGIFAISALVASVILLMFSSKLNKMRHINAFKDHEDPSM